MRGPNAAEPIEEKPEGGAGPEAGAGGRLQLLLFRLGEERCALPLAAVSEILPAASLTSLPGAPAIVEGVLDLRGEPLPVLDVRVRLGISPRPLAPDQHLVVVRRDRPVALRVDRADELVTLAAGDVVDPSTLAPGLGHLAGVARLPDGLVLIHDPAAFLDQTEAEALEAALHARAPSGSET